MKLTAEQIQENWELFIEYIEKHISSPRKEKLLDFYNKYQDRILLMPASHKKEYHNAFPGGYVEHVNRVIEAAIQIEDIWVKMGVEKNYTTEELVFSAINHDLGKIGDEQHEAYVPQTDNWRKEKLGEDYIFNVELEFMSVPDRGLYLLQTHGIEYTKNEYLAIKLHDGIYDEANKPYLMGWLPGQKLRCSLPLIIHQADFLAARIEFEREWLPKFKGNLVPTKNNHILTSKQPINKTSIKTKALSNIQSEGLKNVMDDFFKA
jgi:hypothetical protein